MKRSPEDNGSPLFRSLMKVLTGFIVIAKKCRDGSKFRDTLYCTQYTINPFKCLPLSATVFLVEM